MHPATRFVAKAYGAWALLLLLVTVLAGWLTGHGEYGITIHLLLVFTGLPLSLFSLQVVPNGAPLAVLVAGLIGLVQWCVVSEVNACWRRWRQCHPQKKSSVPFSRTKLWLLWDTALIAPLVAGYGLLSTYFYAWLNASGSWSRERASLWSGGAFIVFCIFAVITVVAVVRLFRYYNSLPPLADQDEVKTSE